MDKEKKAEFDARVKVFMEEMDALQKKHLLIIQPIITTFGPDLQIRDTKGTDGQPKDARPDIAL